MKSALACLLLVSIVASGSQAGDWPGWRGPSGQGLSEARDLPLTWGGKEQKNVLWKVPVPGQRDKARQDQNQSSPIVVRGRVFVTASYWPMGTDPKAVSRTPRRLLPGQRRQAGMGRHDQARPLAALRPARRLHRADPGLRRRARLCPLWLLRAGGAGS